MVEKVGSTLILESYEVTSENVTANISIRSDPDELVPIYELALSKIETGTQALLDKVRETMVSEIPIKSTEILDLTALENLKTRFYKKGLELIQRELPQLEEGIQKYLIGLLIQEMLGLGKLEFLLQDGALEEIVINNSKEAIWVYHKNHGWLKTNIIPQSEAEITNWAANVGRRVGRQITILNPLMDAHLITGDRVNATLFPISTKGNTLTIRKFRRNPWTITDFISNNTISAEVAALLWLAIQYEMNIIVSGGTASGKTSFLNALLPFIQPNQRVISIEDTRELTLPSFLHWVPMTTREPNAEGKGEITMLNLLVNSLRMRPDRIIVGEIRRAREAEVLFEAMHTGHSVYATLHAETAEQTYRRLTNPPIDVPEIMMESLHLVVVCFRDRRRGVRRIFQVSEFISSGEGTRVNTLFRWRPADDRIVKENESYRFLSELKTHTGMSDKDVESDVKDKIKILEWMCKNEVNTVDSIGRLVTEYYTNKERVLEVINKNLKPQQAFPKLFERLL